MAKSSFKFWVRDIVLTILISRFSGIRKFQHDKQGPAGPLEAWLKFEHYVIRNEPVETMLTYTYRLFEAASNERKATAVRCKDGSILQVYPTKQAFKTLEEWRAAWPLCERMEEDKRETRSSDKKPSPSVRRRNQELMEFFETEYIQLYRKLQIVAVPKPWVHIDTRDGNEWAIHRSLNFLEAPEVYKNGERFGVKYEKESYSPALTTLKWWLMLSFIEPEC